MSFSNCGNGFSRTWRQRNRRAQRAWFWVEALTRSFTARPERKALISGSPMCMGWRLLWKKMKRRIQAT
jgi:hypothetical protein